VNIDVVAKFDDSQVYSTVTGSVLVNQVPDIFMTYPDYFYSLKDIGIAASLDDFINDSTYGLNMSDYVTSYINDSKQVGNGSLYSLPFMRYSYITLYNKAKFDNAGITVPSDGILTWDDLDAWADILVDPNYVSGSNDDSTCQYLLDYEVPYHQFISSSLMWDAPYVQAGEVLAIDNATTISMLTAIQSRFTDHTFFTPAMVQQVYASDLFSNGDICMITTGIPSIPYVANYNIDFDMGLLSDPQYDGDNVMVYASGPDIGISTYSTTTEQLASWLFVRYMTSADVSAQFAMISNYNPVQYDSYQNSDYIAYMNQTGDNYYTGLGATYLSTHLEDLSYSPLFFNIPENVSSFSVRSAIGNIIVYLSDDNVSPEDAINSVFSEYPDLEPGN